MMLFLYKQKRCQAGYTLVELMVAVALTGIVTMSIYKSYISVSTGYDVQDQVIEVQQNARVAMDRMVKDIRTAGCSPHVSVDVTLPAFKTIEASEIRFARDITGGAGSTTDHIDNDGDGIVDELDEDYLPDNDVNDPGEDVLYILEAGELKRANTAGGNKDSLIQNVDALRFIYYDENNAITTVLGNVRTVQIALVVRASNEDYSFTDNRLYSIKDLTPAANTVDILDASTLPSSQKYFRRQLLTAVVRCRNMWRWGS